MKVDLDKGHISDNFQEHSVSAVIVNYNGGINIINCIQALYHQDANLENIMVIDNGSTDGSPDKIRKIFPKVIFVELGENIGLSKARNIGLRRATTDLVLIVDDDVYLEEGCLSRLLEFYDEYKPTVICPRIVLFPKNKIVQADGGAPHFIGTMILRHEHQTLDDIKADTTTVNCCLGGCLLVHRERVLLAGSFDEEYVFYLEDLEFSIRLRSLGHILVCAPAAVVYHDRGSGTPGLSFRGKGNYPSLRAYLMLRNRLMTILIHYKIRTLAILLPAFFIYETASLLVALMRGWVAEWARAWLWFLHNVGSIKDRRRWMQHSRSLNDRDFLVGGPLPIAHGFIRSRLEGVAFTVLSNILDTYWRATRKWIG